MNPGNVFAKAEDYDDLPKEQRSLELELELERLETSKIALEAILARYKLS